MSPPPNATPLSQAPVGKRAACQRCGRPQSACICPWIWPLDHATEVLILQHPLEVGHAKNSAGLLHLCLRRSRMLVGEAFDAQAWQALQPEEAPEAVDGKTAPDRYTVLLYPPTVHIGHVPAAPLDRTRLQDPSHVRLVVLDGTWRKSRKMLHRSPALQALPRLSLDDAPASLYAIRKAHKPGQLSTLEATCMALAQLEPGAGPYAPLLQAFQGFVAQLGAHRLA